jgi:hypothetical protein
MAISVVCSACGGRMSAPSQLLGRMAKCPQCGKTVKVAPSTEPPAEPPRQAPARKPKSAPSEAAAGTAQIVVRRSDHGDTPSPNGRIPYGLGIPSLVLGIIALSFGWVPQGGALVSMPLSGLGLLFGIAGLGVAIVQGGRGIGFPIAGSAVSLVAVVFGLVWLGLLSPAKQTATQTSAPAAVAQNQEQSSPTPVKPAPDKEASWIDASKDAVQHGDVLVQLGAVAVRNVRIKDVLGDETVSPTKNLTIQVLLDNTNSTRKIDFLGWSGATVNAIGLADLLGGNGRNKANSTESLPGPERNAATLTDNFGNPYKRISLEPGAQIRGQISTATSVYPRKRIEDLLVFEPPVDKVQYLRLELPATAFGGTGSLRLQIPKGMIHR